MIIRRQFHGNKYVPIKKMQDSGMELKPIFKKVEQPNTANKSPHTALADSSIHSDFNNLLKPIAEQQQDQNDSIAQQNQASRERTERNLWRNDEVMEMLYTMQQVKALEKLNDKTVKSENVFKDVEVIMHKNGFVKKSHVQIWTKWKFLKSTYMTSRRNGIMPRIIPLQVYDTIHKMITGLNQSLADSCSSVDGDTSSVSGMVISGVEGGVSDVGATNGDDEDSFGMAHPIFGFRLGMVKSEPEDTGYEAVENNDTDKDPLDHELSASKSDKQSKDDGNKSAQIPIKELEIPHRGRGRPPKNPPAAISTNNTSVPASRPAQMPPLRVAPFAKALHSPNAIGPSRPPPPLTMPPTPRIRVANLSDLKNDDPVKFVQPKLTPKPTATPPQNSPPAQTIRLHKEITLQPRTSTPSPSYPKMKQIPMRKTPYSLRPDRAIPDLEASLSPPPPIIEKPANKKIEEVPTTKHLSMHSNPNNLQNNVNRKRRHDWQDSISTKQAKLSNNVNNDDDKKSEEKYAKVLQNVIVDLSSSLAKMQTNMMRDFFKRQNEMLEREHKFQMQQDRLIMKAFQKQTQEIMHSVKQLVGGMNTYKNEERTENPERKKRNKVNNKNRMQRKLVQQPEEEEEREMDEVENENEVEDEHEMEQDVEDVYTDGEEQQNDIEDDEEHEVDNQEELENTTANESADEHNENGLTAVEHDDDDESHSSVENNHNPTSMVYSKINKN